MVPPVILNYIAFSLTFRVPSIRKTMLTSNILVPDGSFGVFLRLFVGFKMVESVDIPKISSPEVYSTHFGHIGSISGSKMANFGLILLHFPRNTESL